MVADSARPAATMSALPAQELQLRNPFVLRVGQVMTGFGIGCGLGIGVGRPINLGALPGIGQALSGSGGLTRSFGDVGRQVQSLIKIIGIKNLEAGVGCGVGIGHGFGAGIALKPGVTEQLMLIIQHRLQSLAAHIRGSTGHPSGDNSLASPSSSFDSSRPTSVSLQPDEDEDFSGTSGALRNSVQQTTHEHTQKGFGNKPINSEVDALRSENDILRTLLRHQKIIEDLKEDNATLLRALNLKTNTSPLSVDQGGALHKTMNKLPNACFECRRKGRRR